jgi:Ca-activated chloride channel family protein
LPRKHETKPNLHFRAFVLSWLAVRTLRQTRDRVFSSVVPVLNNSRRFECFFPVSVASVVNRGRTFTGLLLALTILATPAVIGSQGNSPLSVRITSPLGRTGTPGAVRIVARIEAPPNSSKTASFYVDGKLVGTVADGPAYAVEWVDENPFERREIVVDVADSLGHTARDTVVLDPFEVTETAEIFGVLLEAAVRDKNGRFITGLEPSRFSVLEEGVQQVPQLVKQEDVPAMFVLLVDSSQSMSQRFDVVRQAAARLVGYLRPLDRVIVAPFSRDLASLTGPTNDRDTIMGAIGATHAAGGTAIFDNLAQIAERIAPMEGRHAIILITDGYDEHSHATFDDAVQAVKKAQATVYVVGIGGVAGISLRGERQLKQLAAETGGRLFMPPRIQDLASVYDQLAGDAQNRYVLSYTPINQTQDGAWRRVKVSAGADEYLVSTRDGYFAPKAPPVKPVIEFTVTDERQQLIDVTRDDLVVLEDGIEQKVDTFQIAVDPVQIVLALDESGSMKRAVDDVKAAARQFVTALEPKDPLALITFSDRALIAHDLTTNRQWSVEAIEKYQALGGTALYDALYDSIMRLKLVQGRRAVVVLTDGRDENNPGNAPGSVHTLQDVMAAVKDVDAVIYPIGLGSNVDRPLLQRLADLSGGSAYFPADASKLAEQYKGIIESLRRRYVLGYTSTNGARDGGWRTVEITPRSGTLQVRSRGGYFAPER